MGDLGFIQYHYNHDGMVVMVGGLKRPTAFWIVLIFKYGMTKINGVILLALTVLLSK